MMSLFGPTPQPLSEDTLAKLDANREWWSEVATFADGWKGRTARIAWGTGGHEHEWVVNIAGYGFGASCDGQLIPDELGDWVAVELGIEPRTWCVQNRSSRIEVYIGADEGDRLREALRRCGLVVADA